MPRRGLMGRRRERPRHESPERPLSATHRADLLLEYLDVEILVGLRAFLVDYCHEDVMRVIGAGRKAGNRVRSAAAGGCAYAGRGEAGALDGCRYRVPA